MQKVMEESRPEMDVGAIGESDIHHK